MATSKCKVEYCDRTDIRQQSGYCKKHHYVNWKTGSPYQESDWVTVPSDPPFKILNKKYEYCQAPGCTSKTNDNRAIYCEMHYGRIIRNGTLNLKGAKYKHGDTREHSAGYIMEYIEEPEGPFNKGEVYQHRLHYYRTYGNGPFECFDCGKELEWSNMEVHHIDEDKKNNSIDNLACSCHKCNTNASRQTTVKALRKRFSQNHFTYNDETKHINDWAEEYNIPPHVLKWRIKKWGIDKSLNTPYIPYKNKPN